MLFVFWLLNVMKSDVAVEVARRFVVAGDAYIELRAVLNAERPVEIVRVGMLIRRTVFAMSCTPQRPTAV